MGQPAQEELKAVQSNEQPKTSEETKQPETAVKQETTPETDVKTN